MLRRVVSAHARRGGERFRRCDHGTLDNRSDRTRPGRNYRGRYIRSQDFDHHLDWLLGGYYANEKLTLADNLQYGADYNRFTNCIVATSFAAAAPTILAPGASPTCFNTPVATAVRNALVGQYGAALGVGD